MRILKIGVPARIQILLLPVDAQTLDAMVACSPSFVDEGRATSKSPQDKAVYFRLKAGFIKNLESQPACTDCWSSRAGLTGFGLFRQELSFVPAQPRNPKKQDLGSLFDHPGVEVI